MICKMCGKSFVKKSNNQKYCCSECSVKAKKLQDKHNSHKRYTMIKSEKPVLITNCEYCNKTFMKTHGNQKYCSKECKENRNRELNADAANKHYHHVKKLRGGDKVWGLGSGSLGPHKNDDWQVELQKVENEMKRLRILTT